MHVTSIVESISDSYCSMIHFVKVNNDFILYYFVLLLYYMSDYYFLTKRGTGGDTIVQCNIYSLLKYKD